jgi:uncharacterized SAM-binding protein YcdF (DUF218 family)
MIYLHKILPLVLSPLGLVVGFLVLTLATKNRWPARFALIALFISSLPVTAHWIWANLEADYPYEPVSRVPKADAVLVLSGMLTGFESEYGYVTEWGDPDRFFAGIKLMQSGKAGFLVFTRGQMPWSKKPPEGTILKQKAVELGISADQILLTKIASNTEEEASAVKSLMVQYGLKDVILVTSSFHMPRAKLLFNRVGVDAYAYPTDFKSATKFIVWSSFIPSADAFASTSRGLREYLGRIYYQLRFAVAL